MAKPAEGPFHDPAPLQNDKTFLFRLLLDDAMAHAVEIAPFLAMLGREGTIEDGQAQAGPLLLASIKVW